MTARCHDYLLIVSTARRRTRNAMGTGYARIEGNKKADEAAKLVMSRPGCQAEAVAGLNRACTENIQHRKQAWLA